MKILSIETSGALCGTALSDSNGIITQYSTLGGNIHDKLCAEFIRRLLDDNELAINDINAVAVSSGPGSFTGLRIGASIAMALCFNENSENDAPKLISVPTLSAFIHEAVKYVNKFDTNKIVAAIPAQKEVLYFQEFDLRSGSINAITIKSTEEFDSNLSNNIFYCGPYFENVKVELSFPFLNQYSVELISRLGHKMYNDGIFTPPSEFKPIYMQDFKPKTQRKDLKF